MANKNKLLKKLKELWFIYPNKRLGQLISDICLESLADSVYFIEDNILEKEINEELLRIKKSKKRNK